MHVATLSIGLVLLASRVGEQPVGRSDTVRATVSAKIAEDTRTPCFFGTVSGLAIDAQERVDVTDGGEAHIAVFAADGKSLATFGRKGKGPGEFARPRRSASKRHGVDHAVGSGVGPVAEGWRRGGPYLLLTSSPTTIGVGAQSLRGVGMGRCGDPFAACVSILHPVLQHEAKEHLLVRCNALRG